MGLMGFYQKKWEGWPTLRIIEWDCSLIWIDWRMRPRTRHASKQINNVFHLEKKNIGWVYTTYDIHSLEAVHQKRTGIVICNTLNINQQCNATARRANTVLTKALYQGCIQSLCFSNVLWWNYTWSSDCDSGSQISWKWQIIKGSEEGNKDSTETARSHH